MSGIQEFDARSDRPLSVMAADFSAALDSIFDTDDSLFSLSVDLQQKKELIDNQSKELEALETKIKDAENRLKRVKRQSQGVNILEESSSDSAPGLGQTQPPANESPSNSRTAPSQPAARATFNKGLAAPSQLDRPHSSVGNQYTLVDRTDQRRPATSQRA
ncbi:hypothetical protein NA57DRAFT_56000 [Rhizodiscina lignyota]|uniref:Uncharacterized protein n=1 Tax=Rhizodiscina lignyota TaxID=1504668 RepID=A0A9P4IDY9_9PEZI|nr:hypothetical protein NA57DRAFT_56000 [Rhizodiscina lignyota]